jgi:DNA-binding NtrC family response regulator
MAKKPRILVVDDEHTMRDFLSASMAERYRVYTANDGLAAMTILREKDVDLVLSDVQMPGGDGLTLLADIQSQLAAPPLVVMMTAFGTIKEAVEATKRGAIDYLTKPFGLDQLAHTLERAFELRELRNENRTLRTSLKAQREHHGLLGSSRAMIALREKIEMIADSRGTVLLQGESGTGKEVAARAIHNAGSRRGGPFIRLNCAAIPESLLEGELFGHERGAFTGAVQARPGKFELADGGSLLLDEISEMPLSMQVKLLRVIQEREVMRLGARTPVQCDVRIIATTNREMKASIRAGEFREDLFYRLNVIPLRLAPLRERRDDIPLLANHFVRAFAAENGRPSMSITEKAMRSLTSHDWPGNVRQLQNVIERAVILTSSELLDCEQLDLGDELDGRGDPSVLPVDLTIREMEKELILRKLERTGGNRTRAATELGISVRTLRNKLRLYQEHGKSIGV